MTRIEEDGKKNLMEYKQKLLERCWDRKTRCNRKERERERSIKKNIYKRSKIKRNKREGVDWYCRFY